MRGCYLEDNSFKEIMIEKRGEILKGLFLKIVNIVRFINFFVEKELV